MRDEDSKDFREALFRLGRAFGKPTIDNQLILDMWDDLKGYSLPVVQEAMARCRRQSQYFPRIRQLLDACADVARAAAPHIAGLPQPYVDGDGIRRKDPVCRTCQDTGFERGLVCDGTGVCHLRACGMEGTPRSPHGFTRFCACRSTNPVLTKLRAEARTGRTTADGM